MPGASQPGERCDNEDNEDGSEELLYREHSWLSCAFMVCGLSTCITVDILQYSMPLAFLPSVLEDRGHSTMTIATAIGVYYWTGFAGGLMITCYQVTRLILRGPVRKGPTTLLQTRRQIVYLIIGLGCGALTLAGQALYPHCFVHTICRCIQGLAGAFIFFYAFLLSVAMFKGAQQVFAMTVASTALNVAEVLGSALGAVLFDRWGQRSVFWFLGVVSLWNQVLLLLVILHLEGHCTRRTPGGSPSRASQRAEPLEAPGVQQRSGWTNLLEVLRSQRLACAVILIVMAAIVKGSVEEMLPFHADHRWGFGPMKIGKLFSITAAGYILSAVACGKVWTYLQGWQVLFSAFWLMLLGCLALIVFLTSAYSKSEVVLWAGLATYGVCLGLTHTPAALLLAEAIEHEEGRAKDAVNGIWNTMWEAGGSLGFLLGGVFAEDYSGQLRLLAGCSVCCIVSSCTMLAVAPREADQGKAGIALKAAYGSTAL